MPYVCPPHDPRDRYITYVSDGHDVKNTRCENTTETLVSKLIQRIHIISLASTKETEFSCAGSRAGIRDAHATPRTPFILTRPLETLTSRKRALFHPYKLVQDDIAKKCERLARWIFLKRAAERCLSLLLRTKGKQDQLPITSSDLLRGARPPLTEKTFLYILPLVISQSLCMQYYLS